jgi:hypothetical protein
VRATRPGRERAYTSVVAIGGALASGEHTLLATKSDARAPDAPARVRMLEAFLLERMLNRELDPRAPMPPRARWAGCSSPTWVSPQAFRAHRPCAALRELLDQSPWTPLALELGYHDQAHFIHDLRAVWRLTRERVARCAYPLSYNAPLPLHP